MNNVNENKRRHNLKDKLELVAGIPKMNKVLKESRELETKLMSS